MKTCLVTVMLLVVAAGVDASSTTDGDGVLAGAVLGPGGAGLPGAVVEVSSEETGSSAAVVSGEGGEFRVAGLAPATYQLSTQLAGFVGAPLSAVRVEPRRTTRVEVVLASATFTDAVEVDAVSPHNSMEAVELRESGARDAGEALARLPGVWKVRKGGIANDIAVRGLREDNLAVLVDGARVAGACPNRMDPATFHLDFAEVDRLEVSPTDGRLAVQGALGGLVNVVTRKPEAGLNAEANLVGGSFGLLNPAATASWRGERLAILAGGSHRESEPYRDGSGRRMTEGANYTDTVEGVDAYAVDTGWTRFYVEPGEGHELNLSYSRQEADDVLYPTLMMDAVYDDTDRLVLGYNYAGDSGLLRSLRATGYVTRVDHWMVDSLRQSAVGTPRGWSMGTLASTEIIGTMAEAELGSSLTLGFEAYRRNWDAWTEMAGMGYMRQASIPDVDLEAIGASARWRRQLGEPTRLELGGRVDHVSTVADESIANTDLYFAYHSTRSTTHSDTEPSGSLRITHQFGNELGLSAGITRSTRAADPRERYFALKRSGADWVGNPELETPRDTSADVALNWGGGGGSVSFAAWYDLVTDFITVYGQERVNMVPGVMSPRARSYANVDARLWGASVAGTAALSTRLYLAGTLSYVQGSKDARTELGIQSGALAEMPPLTGRLSVRWQNPRLFAELETVAAGRQSRVDAALEEEPTAGWAILNLRTGTSYGPWRLQVVLENLLDRSYREHFSSQRDPYRSGFLLNEPGRAVTATVGWRS